MSYWLAVDYGMEGWRLKEYQSEQGLFDAIKKETFGQQWKVFKELKIKIEIEDK